MASRATATSLGVRVTAGAPAAARFATTAISAGVFASGAPYASSSSMARDDQANLKAWLPPHRVPLVDSRGLMTWEWYRFFQYVAEKRLGGATAPSIAEISHNVIAAKQQAVAANESTAALAAQTVANAEALEVTRQVALESGLVGAVQIPPVVRRYIREQVSR